MNLVLDFDGRRLQGARPFAVFESRGSSFEVGGSNIPQRSGRGDGLKILDEIRRALNWSRKNVSTRGAAIGFFSYDFARTLEPRAFSKTSSTDDLQIPDIRLVFCEELEHSMLNVERSEYPAGGFDVQKSAAHLAPPADYAQSISRIQEYIAAGDIYQANYAERFSFGLPCAPAQLYHRLQSTHAAPFAALLEWDDFSIVSNSPERFLKLEREVLTTQPIKGTMRRGSTPSEDEAFKTALQNSPKDRAENVMIVDLLRNDLGRVCQYGSIEVPQLFQIQTFPTLHHLVSTVTGILRADCDALSAFGCAFPCGSITGAPKMRAMQIIDELEATRRASSFGAIGYFGFDGGMEWNVAIRTLLCKDGLAHFHAGGGIVEGSNARDEYCELQLKAHALKQLLGAQERDE
jgi:para-aminobenzoate synthetase component 1